jgi:hypothetical protein
MTHIDSAELAAIQTYREGMIRILRAETAKLTSGTP